MHANRLVLVLSIVAGTIAPATAASASAAQLCDSLAGSPYADGTGVPFDEIDAPAAIEACEAAVVAEGDDPTSRFNLGRAYDAAGRTGSAIAAYLHAGTPLALYSLGTIHEGGYGVEVNGAEARRHYDLAADAAVAAGGEDMVLGLIREAQGRMHEHGIGGDQDFVRAAELYGEAIGLGFAPASGSLGFLHEKGMGVPQDERRALELYRAAADAGEAFAIHNVAVYHAEGRGGIAADPARAAELYAEAAELGWEPSMLNLAMAHASGAGVERDASRAEALFRQVIDLEGDLAMEARNSLAWMFALDGTSLDEALVLATAAVEAEPDNANYLDTLAWVLHRAGRHDAALVHAEKAVAIEPRPSFLEHLDEIRSAAD